MTSYLGMTRLIALLILAILARPARALAQSAQNAGSEPAVVDAAKLGVSLDRIARELSRADAREQSVTDGALRLTFTVEVFGQAPKIDLLRDFPIIGPAQYGGPTHREVIDFLTPQAFKAPTMPFSAMAFWAAQKIMARSKKQRCEDEIAEYNQLVMSGVPVAAPRCTQ